ncbi:MAG: helix-turn-helix domain-containing protein [Bacteroidia bacterium]
MEKQVAKTRQQIADAYGIDRRTLYRWLKAAGIQLSNRLITPAEQEIIYQKFGKPTNPQKKIA